MAAELAVPQAWSRKTTGSPQVCLWLRSGPSKTGAQQGNLRMATFNSVFTTQRLVQIIVVLGATVLMKLLT